MKFIKHATVCIALLALPFSMSAQSSNAGITGLVDDPAKAAITGAKITVINTDTGVRTTVETNDQGGYAVPGLNPGPYRVEVEKIGFKSIIDAGLTLHVQDNVQLNFHMALGSTSESISVQADAVNINTTDASVSTVIDRNFADNLPMNGRTFQTLIYLTPGVTFTAEGGFGMSGQFTVNGQRASSNYWTVDGTSANIGISSQYVLGPGAAGGVGAFNVLGGTNGLVSVDALQEFRVATSTYAPEYGRTPGGQISIVTRSGTNQFHGSLFDYFRNTALDANNWFNDANRLPKAAEHQNDFGGVLGGPLLKNKTFFFFSYEGLRLRLPETYLTKVPDLAARQNAIPSVQPFLDAFPLPNPGASDAGPGVAPFDASLSNPARVDSYSLRIDHTLTSRLNIFGRYNYSPSTINQRLNGTSLNTITNTTSNSTTATAGATWTQSSHLVNEARFNYSLSGGDVIDTMDDFGGGTAAPAASMFPNPFSYQTALFAFVPTGVQYYAEGRNAGNRQHQYNVVNTLSVQEGSHSLKFGFDYRRLSPFLNPPQYLLYPLFSNVASAEAGNSEATITEHEVGATFLFHNFSMFAQDTWRMSPRLTLTFGLRWDVDFTPSTESGPSIPAVTGFSYANLSNLALAPPGTAIYRTKYGNVAPRIGVGYQIAQRPDWGLVLRGGFGVFYDLASTEIGNGQSLFAYPFDGVRSSPGVPFPPTAAVAALPAVVPPTATQGTLYGFDPKLSLPYSLQWNAALQQSLGKDQSLTVSYVGSSGRRLLATETVSAPNSTYMSAVLVSNPGSSNYNALQVQFQRHLSEGLQALASYSWAHSIDTGSYGNYADGTFASINANRADSDFDIRHTFSAALTYNLPVPTRNAFARALLGRWSTENIIQIRSAPPVSIVDDAFAALVEETATVLIRPDLVSGQPLYLYGPQYPGGKALNPNAFTNPPTAAINGVPTPTRQGDLARNAVRGFGLSQWDFAIHRDFPLHEAVTVQFRAEMFNLLNHPNFAPYDSGFGSGDTLFGQSTQMLSQSLATGPGTGSLSAQYQLGGPRSIQLALKLVF